MTEVEEICDRIGVISRGRLIAVGTVEELRDRVREKEGVRYLLVLGQYYPTHPPNRTTTALYDFAHAILQNTLNILG